MPPTHHPPEDLLLEYASGVAPEGVALLVATHLALCPRCRARDAALDALGGELLDGLEPAPMGAGPEAVLARLDAPPAPPPPAPAPPAPSAPELPRPLRDYVGPLGAIRWRRLAPGIRQVELPVAVDGVPVRLVSLRGGMVLPAHTHSDDELSLILAGGLTDERGHFQRGDVSAYTAADTHTQRIDRGGPCITLAVNRGRMIPVDWKGKLLNMIVGGF